MHLGSANLHYHSVREPNMINEFNTYSALQKYKTKHQILTEAAQTGLDLGDVGFLELYRSLEAVLNWIILELGLTSNFAKKLLDHCTKEGLAPVQAKKLLQVLNRNFVDKNNKLTISHFDLAREVILHMQVSLEQKVRICEKVFGFTKLNSLQNKNLKGLVTLRNHLVHSAGLLEGVISCNSTTPLIIFLLSLAEHLEHNFSIQIVDRANELKELREKIFYLWIDQIIITGYQQSLLGLFLSALSSTPKFGEFEAHNPKS